MIWTIDNPIKCKHVWESRNDCGWFKRQYFEKAQQQARPPPPLMTKAFKCFPFVWNSSLRSRPQQWRYIEIYRVIRFLKEKKDLGALTAPTSRSKRTAFTAHSWGSWWAGASHSWEILMMVFVLHCVSTCSLTRRWTSPCLHARIRALCSAKYRAETFPTDQGTKKGYNLFTL